MEELSEWFWNDYFWLPKGISFKDLRDTPDFHFAKARDLPMMLVYAVWIYIVRRIFEKLATKPIATRLGLKHERNIPEDNKILQNSYKLKKLPTTENIKTLAKEVNWTAKKVSNWFRRRRNMDRPSLYQKLAEASWRCAFYTFAFTFGMCMLVEAPWFWDTLYCWVDYPRQTLWPAVYYYYMLEGGFYVSLLISLLFMGDIRRNDFTEQLIHHLATIFLIVFSYVANFVRVGTLVMAIHDISDIILEFAKCFVYAKKKDTANLLFNIFAVVFIVSRIFIYPYAILHTTWVKSMWLFSPYPGYYFFNFLLFVLQLLHVFWAGTILKMAYKVITKGGIENDERSDAEETTDGDDEEELKKIR